MKNVVWSSSLALAIVAGCSSATERPANPLGSGSSVISTSTGMIIRLESDDTGVSAVIDADSARVWGVLPEVYDSLGIAASVVGDPGLVWGNPRFNGTRIDGARTDRYVRCATSGAGPGSAGGYRTQLSITSRVQGQADGRTLLTTSVHGTARTVEGTSTAPSRCASNGRVEARIAGMVAELLAQP